MKKAVIILIIIAALCGGGYYAYSQGLIDQYFPGLLEKVIPGYEAKDTSDSRVSSDSDDAVHVDSVSVVAELGSGNGLIPRFAGTVEPQETKEYKLDSDRSVKTCYVEEGEEVRKGQKLFSYDTSEEEDKLEQANIDLERLQNELDTSQAAKDELEKQKAQANTAAKELEILTKENEIKQNELDQKSKKKEIESLEEKIKNSVVYCDMDGIIQSINDSSSSDADIYASSDSSSAYITILKAGTYRIKASANEQNIDQIFTGERVLVFSRLDSSIIWKGAVSEIKTDQANTSNNEDSYSDDTDSGSTDYPFYVELDDSEGLMLGQHVYMEQDLGQEDAKSGLWLDDYYIQTDEDGSYYVWAASSANRIEKRTVELGESDLELQQTQIKSGLTTDDYICAPSSDVEEGLPVVYNDPSGEETESMYTYDMDVYSLDETELYGLDEGVYGLDESSTEDWLWDETELLDDEY